MTASTSTTIAAADAAPQVHPVRELLQRYAALFKAAWAARDELAGPRRLADEQAFLPAALALQATPPHPAPRRFMLAICALFTLALLWSLIGQLDIVAVSTGRIVVNDRTKVIQPLETSSVKAIHVRDGDRVQAGQLLVELDGTAQGADASRVAQERDAAQSETARTEALLTALTRGGAPKLPAALARQPGVSTQLDAEWADLQAKQSRLAAEYARRQAELTTAEQVVAKLNATLPLAQAREKDFQDLAKQGFVAGHATQDRQRERVELERDLATARARVAEAQAALQEARSTQASQRAEWLRTLNERRAQAQLRAGQLQEEGTKARQRQELTRLTAPVAGTVQQLAVHTAGGVVTPAQALMVIVPDKAEVVAEIVIENKDIGFLAVGQPVAVKVSSFPFTRYGTIPARLISIDSDATLDQERGNVFSATICMERNEIMVDGKVIPLKPGMNVIAEVFTGKRRIIDFLLDPIKVAKEESLREM